MGPEIFVHTNYDFVGKRHFFIGLSLSILAVSALSIFTKGFNYGVEFTGGSQLEINFNEKTDADHPALPKKEPTIADVRSAIDPVAPGASVVTTGAAADHDFLIRVQSTTGGSEHLGDDIREAIVGKFGEPKISYWGGLDPETRDSVKFTLDDPNATPDDVKAALAAAPALKGVRVEDVRKDHATGEYTITLANAARDVLAAIDAQFGKGSYEQSSDAIGAAVSHDLRTNAFLAIGLACILIAVYIWLRFEVDYAPGVVVALIHDAGITMGIWSIFGKLLPSLLPDVFGGMAHFFEFNLTFVAAVLAIIGYSVTDTVVVYDRIRENLEKHQSQDMYWNINRAVNDTLSRTILTSLATWLSVIAIALVGSESIRGFGVAMAIGIIVGTYSSIYIAAPVTVFVHEFRERQRKAQMQQQHGGGTGGAPKVPTKEAKAAGR